MKIYLNWYYTEDTVSLDPVDRLLDTVFCSV